MIKDLFANFSPFLRIFVASYVMGSQGRPSTYGIHFVKVVAICHQVVVHAQAWLTNAYPGQNEVSPSHLALRAILLDGAISMTVPMTAAAILRLNFEHSPLQRLKNIAWKPYFGLCGALMLLESCKQLLVYGRGGFFEWDALHTIALTFLLILTVARYSIAWLWPVAIGMILVAPSIVEFLAPFERGVFEAHPPTGAYDPDILGQAFAVVFMIPWAIIFYNILASRLSERIKIRLTVANIIVGLLGVCLCETVQNQWGDEVVLRLLPIGALVGSFNGQHIWGIFPWAGVIILGFLIYDLLLRKPSNRWLFGMAATGASFIAIFYWQFVLQAIERCTPRGKFSGFGGVCFNRTPGHLFLIVGCFLILVVMGRFAETWGWETRAVRAMSRSILWIYLFATTILQNLAAWWVLHIPKSQIIWSFVVFSLVCSYLLAMLIDRIPLHIAITLKKNERTA